MVGRLLQSVFTVSSYLEVCYDYSGVTCNTCLRYFFAYNASQFASVSHSSMSLDEYRGM